MEQKSPTTKNRSLPSRSWQEIYQMYRIYGYQLIELARVKKTFGFSMTERGVLPSDFMFDVAQHHFQVWVDEINGMLILLDAEITRRNALIGVMG